MDRSAEIFGFYPAAWGNGNGNTSFNVGNMPTPDSIGQPVEAKNTGAGKGFIYDAAPSGSHAAFDFVNDYWSTALPSVIKRGMTIRARIKNTVTGVFSAVVGSYKDASNQWRLMRRNDNGYILYIVIGGTPYSIQTSVGYAQDTVIDMTATLGLDGVGHIFYSGSEVGSYISQQTVPDVTTVFGNTVIGSNGNGGAFMNGENYHTSIHNRVFSDAEILANASLPNSMGYTANNVDGLLYMGPIPSAPGGIKSKATQLKLKNKISTVLQ